MRNEHKMEFEDVIKDFCERITPNFEDLLINYRKLYPDQNTNKLAIDLMEFGRGQISGIEEPTESDIHFMKVHVNRMNFREEKAGIYQAYASGCIMGLILSKQLESHMFIPAMEISAGVALSKYAPDLLHGNKKPNAILELVEKTAWDDLKSK